MAQETSLGPVFVSLVAFSRPWSRRRHRILPVFTVPVSWWWCWGYAVLALSRGK